MSRLGVDLTNILGYRHMFDFCSRLYQTEVSPFDLAHICCSSLFQSTDPSPADFRMETVLYS